MYGIIFLCLESDNLLNDPEDPHQRRAAATPKQRVIGPEMPPDLRKGTNILYYIDHKKFFALFHNSFFWISQKVFYLRAKYMYMCC